MATLIPWLYEVAGSSSSTICVQLPGLYAYIITFHDYNSYLFALDRQFWRADNAAAACDLDMQFLATAK